MKEEIKAIIGWFNHSKASMYLQKVMVGICWEFSFVTHYILMLTILLCKLSDIKGRGSEMIKMPFVCSMFAHSSYFCPRHFKRIKYKIIYNIFYTFIKSSKEFALSVQIQTICHESNFYVKPNLLSQKKQRELILISLSL
jgi:hypothetical protein